MLINRIVPTKRKEQRGEGRREGRKRGTDRETLGAVKCAPCVTEGHPSFLC